MGNNPISRAAIWILMGLLIIGLAGFGVTNLSGNVRSVGSVGDARIDVGAYSRALQAEIRAVEAEEGRALSFAEARNRGIDSRVLAQLVAGAALDHETRRIGISLGDENLRRQLLQIPAFQGADGGFNRESYAFAMQQAGMNEAEFEETIRAETARSVLQTAVLSGVRLPRAYTDTLLSYIAERRDATWAVLDRSDLATGLPVPDEGDLRRHHADHEAAYTRPEIRRITFVQLTPEMIIDTVEVAPDALRAAYDDRADTFNQPERRLVERLVYPDAARARDAMARIAAGNDFEDLVAARGLDLADTDMGDVSRQELGEAAEAVFAAEVGAVVGPLPSPLGPALFRINATFEAQNTPFEEVEGELRDALAGDRARRVIDAQIEQVDDLLVGGATLEDVARETDMELGRIDWHPGLSDGIAAHDAFRNAAAEVATGHYPQVEQLDAGGIFALRLDEVITPQLRPLAQVRREVLEDWRRAATVDALRAQTGTQVSSLRNGATFDSVGLTAQSADGLSRNGYRPDTPPGFLEALFEMDPGDLRLLEGDGRLVLLRLDAVAPPDDDDPELAPLRRALRDQAGSGLGQDLYQALAADIRSRAGVQIDQSALNAVHANFN